MALLLLLRPGALLHVQSQPSCVATHCFVISPGVCVCLCVCLCVSVCVYDDRSSFAGVPRLPEAHQGLKEDQEEEDKEEGDSDSEGKWFLYEIDWPWSLSGGQTMGRQSSTPGFCPSLGCQASCSVLFSNQL